MKIISYSRQLFCRNLLPPFSLLLLKIEAEISLESQVLMW